MPIYEYVCGECSTKFERLVRAWGESVACPSCQGTSVLKQLSAFSLGGGRSDRAPSSGACCGGNCGCAH